MTLEQLIADFENRSRLYTEVTYSNGADSAVLYVEAASDLASYEILDFVKDLERAGYLVDMKTFYDLNDDVSAYELIID